MISPSLLVHPSAAVAVGAHPEAPRAVLGHAQHGHRRLARVLQSEVPYVLFIRRDGIQSVAVAGHPQRTVACHEDAHHTGIANGVRCPELPTQVAETVRTHRLHKHTLLQQSYPQVTALVLNHAHRLTLLQVDLGTEVRNGAHRAVLDVILHHTLTVAAQQQVTVAPQRKGSDMQVLCRGNQLESLAAVGNKAVQSVGASHKHLVFLGNAYRCERVFQFVAVQELAPAGTAEQVYAVILRYHPDASSAVLGQAVRVLNICVATLQLACLLPVGIHAVDTVARGRYQNLFVLALNDAGHKGCHLLSCTVNHGNLGEHAVLVALQRIRHTYIDTTCLCLHNAVHTVVGQAPRAPESPERITVVCVQSIHRGNPDAPLLVLEHLVDNTAGQLVAGGKESSRLGKRPDGNKKYGN